MSLLLGQNTGKKFLVFVGSHSAGPSTGITVFDFDSQTGALSHPRLVAEVLAPSFMALTNNGDYLYSCNSSDNLNGKQEGGLSAFKMNKNDGSLLFINQNYSGGMNPCHISLDKTNKYAFVANYNGGNIAVYRIQNDGSIGQQTAFFQHTGKSINHARQEKAHAHCIKADPTNHFVLAADLGADKLFVYKFDSSNGSLKPNTPAFATIKPGSGPRHFTFHNNGKWLYLANELNATITVFDWDGQKGHLHEIQTISTLPVDFKEANKVAEIQVYPNGKFLYCTNRGHNSLAVYEINDSTGKLQFIEHISTMGEAPRNFEFDPYGKWMIVANHDSNNLVIFSVDANSGHLTQTGQAITMSDSPYNVRFLDAEK